MSGRRVVPDVLAAVDLGSNSFHMVVARYSHGQLVILDRLREMVRLAAGLGDSGRLDDAATDRALRCLERFGQRLRAMRADSVRVVGTNALRRARRKRWFLERARAALGHPIEIISGLEEARLIYSGVAHTSPMSPDKRLVIDIGGGSTEAVIGQGFEPLLLESLSVGCVGLSAICFDDGRISAKRFERARTAVRLELEPIQEAYRKLGWLQAFGSSGTVRVIGDVLRSLNPEAPHITLDNLYGLAERVIAAGHVDELDLPDVDAERAPVFPAGLAILLEVVESFGIDRVRVAEGAMREGLLYDLMGRFTDEDARVRSVRAMEKRYHIDVNQAERVELTAVALLEQVESEWGLEDPLAESRAALGGAAARNRPRYRALQIPPPQRLPAGERRHAGLSARGAAAPGGVGRRPSPPVVLRVARGFAAAVGSAGGVSDRAAAPRGTAASRPQPATAAGGPLDAPRAAP